MTIDLQGPLVLVGAGKMGGALLAGWLDKGLMPKDIFVRDPSPAPEVAKLIAEKGIGLNFSVADLVARKPAVVVLWQSVVGAICFIPLGLWYWQTPTLPQLGLFVAAGFFGTMGYFFITWAYRLLDISALQSITFLAIVWAALMDVAVWGKTADIWTFVGAAIIVASTTYIAHRESRTGAVAKGKKA